MTTAIKMDTYARKTLDPLAIGIWELEGLRFAVQNADGMRHIINTDTVAMVLKSGLCTAFLQMLGPGLRLVRYNPETGVGTFDEVQP